MKKLRVAWISTAALDKTARGLTSDQASMRYRMLIPSAALQALGCESSVLYAVPAANRRAILSRLEGVDAVVIAKVLFDGNRFDQEAPGLLQLVAEIGARGIKLLADFSDNTFLDPRRGPIDRSLANLVDLVVVSTPGLAQVLRGETHVPVVSVTDPVEGQRGEPRVAVDAGAPLKLLWFGHWANFHTLQIAWEQLTPLAAERSLSWVILSRPGVKHEEAVAMMDAEWRKTGSACRFRSWSVATVFEALRECDAVVIPSDPQHPEKSIKSPNRFCESVWAGRFVVAHPLPSYQLLAAGGWVGADLAEGLRWMLAQPDEALARIHVGQSAVAAAHSPEAVGQAWKRVIETAIG